MEYFALWFLFSIVVAIAAATRGRSGLGWFILAMAISPLLALILLVLLPKLADETSGPRPDTHVKCPDCRELILKDAKVCKHCRCRLIPQV